MVFDPQCRITDQLASVVAGKLVSRTGRHWGPFIELSARLLSEGRRYPPHFPIAVQTTCDASLVATSAIGLSTGGSFLFDPRWGARDRGAAHAPMAGQGCRFEWHGGGSEKRSIALVRRPVGDRSVE